jgi:hypothetical protein
VNLAWLPYLAKMLASQAVRDLLRDLWQLTGGDTAASSKALRRMRDQGVVLFEAEREIDADLTALKERQERARPK